MLGFKLNHLSKRDASGVSDPQYFVGSGFDCLQGRLEQYWQ